MPEQNGGLYEKYEVQKDGEPVEGCFVLEPDSDSAAREALITYAEHTDDGELAADLREWIVDVCTRDETDREPATDGGYRPPCEAVAHTDPTPPNATEYGLERRACPNCRLYFDVGAETDKVFCSGACRRRHERGELIADGGVDQTDREEEQDWSDQPYLETSLDEDAILADCPECHDPMLLGEYWKELIDDGTIDLPPECPDCEPEEWVDDADVKVSGVEVWALAE